MSDIAKSLLEQITQQSNCLTVKDTPSNAVVTLKQRHVLRLIEDNERLRGLLREALRIDAGDFSVSVDDWIKRVREALGE